MSLILKKDFRWTLVVPTSIGVRLTPLYGQPVHSSNTFIMQATSAETNVATIPAYLGMPVKVLTKFVKGSPIARFIKNDLAARNLHFEGVEVEQGSPWGYRHQFNVADSGYGVRGPQVANDRAGEVGRTLSTKDFNLDHLFEKEGVQIVHISGLIAALSQETGHFCLDFVKKAKKYNTKVSFDLNYRASFWKNREKELRSLFKEIAAVSDILIGNEEDFQYCLGFKGPETGGKDIATKINNFKEMILNIKKSFPNTSVFGTTLREVINTNRHLWGAVVLEGGDWTVVEPREINVLDRIGGGDGFVGGLIYGILNGWEMKKCVQFGWASGALATTFLTDYAQPTDEDTVWNVWAGNARVKR